jgi:UDP:flavonoid glycosyltransferase YjiC (YdhE family)
VSVRVLFCCWPFEGHVFPQLSIARALRARGGEAAFFTERKFGSVVETEGATLFGFRRVEAAWAAVRERERVVGGRRQSLRVAHHAFRQWLVRPFPTRSRTCAR